MRIHIYKPQCAVALLRQIACGACILLEQRHKHVLDVLFYACAVLKWAIINPRRRKVVDVLSRLGQVARMFAKA